MNAIKTHTAAHTITVPLGSTFGAWLFLTVGESFKALKNLTRRHPQVSTEGSRTAEASRLRQQAQDFMSSDPRFAADLFAAADRHERNE